MHFQDDALSFPTKSLKDPYLLVFDLRSLQDATENSHHPELQKELENYWVCSQTILFH